MILIPAPGVRGREHAHELAQAFSQILGAPVQQALEMKGPEVKQRRLNIQERSLREFVCREEFTSVASPARRLILIDDVVTSGATAEAAREALGLAQIEVWCLAYRSRLAARG